MAWALQPCKHIVGAVDWYALRGQSCRFPSKYSVVQLDKRVYMYVMSTHIARQYLQVANALAPDCLTHST